jgi:hypothetical protein
MLFLIEKNKEILNGMLFFYKIGMLKLENDGLLQVGPHAL